MQVFETFVKELSSEHFAAPVTKNAVSCFYPQVGAEYLCIKDVEVEDFYDSTFVAAGERLHVIRKSGKCVCYAILQDGEIYTKEESTD